MHFVKLIVLVLLSISSYGQNARPNFLVIMADDCTYRDLGVYGGQARTPHLNKFAEEGMKFNRCFQATAMCAPTRQNLLTGIYPVRNGAYANHTQSYDHVKSIVHHMKPAGYRMGLTGKRHIGPEKVYPFEYSRNTQDPDPEFIKAFINQSKAEGQPFCLFAMASSPHVPWTYGDPEQYPTGQLRLPPYLIDTEETRRAFAMYLAEIEYFDQQVGQILQLLDESGQKDQTVVMVLSEQGSLFPFEKWTCYDAGLQSGFLARYPGEIEAGSIADAMVEYVDITPTILDLAGISPLEKLDGLSFKDVLLGKADQHKQLVFGIQTTSGVNEATQPFGIRSVRNDSIKYILNLFPENQFENALLMDPEQWSDSRRSYLWWMNSWREAAAEDPKAKQILHRYQYRPVIELYHVIDDPYELVNLALDPAFAEVMDLLHRELMAWMQRQGDEGRATELKVRIEER
jgi:uncharacterized sulfatase